MHSLKQVLESGIGYQGIKQKCFLQSQYFCPVENYVADFHHDVLEGVVPYVLKIVLQVLYMVTSAADSVYSYIP